MSLATPTVWRTAIVIANLFMAAYMEARARTLDHASGVANLLGTRDQHFAETTLLEREVFRSMRQRIPPKQRPHYSPEARHNPAVDGDEELAHSLGLYSESKSD